MRATDVLKQHHREIEELFRQLRHGGENDDERSALRAELADLIAAHTATEEDAFYPIALDLLGSGCRVFEATEEHAAVGFMLIRAMSVSAKDDRFAPRLETLYDIFMNHIEEEESELFAQFEGESDPDKSEELARDLQSFHGRMLKMGHVAILSERVKLPAIGMPQKVDHTKKSKVRRGQFKLLSIGTLPRVFVNLLAQDDEGIVIFAEAMNECEEMKTWFETTKEGPIHCGEQHDEPIKVPYFTRYDLAKFFLAVLNLSKVARGMFVKDFDRLLNDLGTQDFWGTEG